MWRSYHSTSGIQKDFRGKDETRGSNRNRHLLLPSARNNPGTAVRQKFVFHLRLDNECSSDARGKGKPSHYLNTSEWPQRPCAPFANNHPRTPPSILCPYSPRTNGSSLHCRQCNSKPSHISNLRGCTAPPGILRTPENIYFPLESPC